MAKMVAWKTEGYVEAKPKKTRQGKGKHTKYAASSRNKAPKRTRGCTTKRQIILVAHHEVS